MQVRPSFKPQQLLWHWYRTNTLLKRMCWKNSVAVLHIYTPARKTDPFQKKKHRPCFLSLIITAQWSLSVSVYLSQDSGMRWTIISLERQLMNIRPKVADEQPSDNEPRNCVSKIWRHVWIYSLEGETPWQRLSGTGTVYDLRTGKVIPSSLPPWIDYLRISCQWQLSPKIALVLKCRQRIIDVVRFGLPQTFQLAAVGLNASSIMQMIW